MGGGGGGGGRSEFRVARGAGPGSLMLGPVRSRPDWYVLRRARAPHTGCFCRRCTKG